MNKKEALRELIQNLEMYSTSRFRFHSKFMKEFENILKRASGNEKEIFSLLIKQLNFVKMLNKEVYKADSNEIIRYQEREYYSLHLSGKNFNFRLLMAFDEANTPVFLAAFYERSGKKASDYSKWYNVLDSRYDKM